ncbi:MAG: ABC transporter substrate-binding protein [Candidatus Methanoperedens sp.]|nr:ABC transporter substrate-binding protein [Candidatus Methanoperedens sp.]
MKNNIKYLISGIVILVLIGAYFALNSSGTNSDIAPTKDVELYTLKMVTSPAYDPVSVGFEKGFFKEEGLNIEFVGVLPTEQYVTATVSGDIDVGGGHANRVINAVAKGAKIKGIAGTTRTIPGYPHMSLFVLENSSIRTAQDLTGKKVAIWGFGGCSEYMMYEYMRQKAGSSIPKESIELTSMPDSQQEQALRSHQVDAVFVHAPFNKKLTNAGGVRKLFDDNDLDESLGLALYWVSEDTIKDHPDVVKRFVKTTAKTLDWANEHREEAYQIEAKRLGLDAADMEGFNSPEHALLIDTEVQNWIDTLTRYGLLKEGQVKTSDIYTNEFNPYFKDGGLNE